MKKRIISLILAVVMLFSCLSLNIFAADSTGEGGTETTPDHTTDEQKLALIKANTEIGRQGVLEYSWGNGETGGTTNNGSTRLTRTDGHYIVGARTDASATGNEHFIQFSDHSDYGGRDSIQYYAQTPLKGATFTVSLDVEFTDEFVGKTAEGTPNTPNNVSIALMQTAFYLTTSGGGNGGKSQMGTYMPNLLDVTVSGEKITLRALDAGSYRNVIELNVNENYNIAITVDPKDNPGKDKYGSFSVYLNGEMVGHRYGFMHATHNAQSTFSTENPRAYFIDNAFSVVKVLDENGNVVKDSNGKEKTQVVFNGGMAYFFVPEGTVLDVTTDTDEDGIPDIYENVTGITAESAAKITGYTCIGTCEGAKDMVLGFVRINQISAKTYYDADAIYIDNIGVYYGEYVDLNTHQYIADNHAHDYKALTTTVDYSCACGATKTDAVAIDANGDRVCDLCVSNAKLGGHNYAVADHEHDTANGTNTVKFECTDCGKTNTTKFAMTDLPIGKVLTTEELAATGVETIANNPISQNTSLGRYNPTGSMAVVEEAGNYYIKYTGHPDGAPGNTYYQVNGKTGGRDAVLEHFNEYRGKSYTVSADVKFYGQAVTLWQFAAYGTAPTYTDETKTVVNQIDALTFNPLRVTAGGQIVLYDGSKETYVNTALIKIEPGKFYNIALHHNPKNNTMDLFVDGSRIIQVNALCQTYRNKFDWTCSVLNTKYNDAKIDYTDPETKTFTMTPEDFMIGFVKFTTLPASAAKGADYVAFDNIKIYYTEAPIECVHSYVEGSCEWCGEKTPAITHCDICDGKVISAGAAITGRSATLGELIDMNVYMTLSERLASTEGAKITLTAGNRSAEYILTEATKGDDGKYKFSIPLRSSQMADDVVVTLTGDGTAETYTTSIKDYAEELIATSSNDMEIKLAKSMLNYGAASQTYFAVKNNDPALDDKLANSGFEPTNFGEIPLEGIESFRFVSEGATENVRFTAISLVLSSKTHVNLYFTASEDATVTIGDKAVSKTATDSGEYYITFTVESPLTSFEMIDVTLVDGDTTVNASASAFSAVYAGLTNEDTNPNLAALLSAYGWYCNFAFEYANQ